MAKSEKKSTPATLEAAIIEAVPGLPDSVAKVLAEETIGHAREWLERAKIATRNIDNLPHVLGALKGADVFDHLIRLVARYGGENRIMPIIEELADTTNPWVRDFGLDAARYFAQVAGGKAVRVPTAGEVVSMATNRTMAEEFDLGVTLAALAEKHNVNAPWALDAVSRYWSAEGARLALPR